MKKNQLKKEEKFPLIEAKKIAEDILEQLKPHCERIEIAGSIRRNKSDIGDVDLVMIPKNYETGLFSTGISTILDNFEKVKGDLIYGQTRNAIRIHPKGLKLDCYFCESDNYGLIKTIRTGSENFNRTILIPAINRAGYRSRDGHLTFEDEIIEVTEEENLFKLIRLGYVEPEKRN
jgi:DNA polymerase/3'-5' exonuclease PolX